MIKLLNIYYKMKRSELKQIIREEYATLRKSFTILEAKQVGILYHVVDKYAFAHNLINNRFDGTVGINKTVSFTRCKDYTKYGESPVLARFILDGDKMSNNYKFTPVDEFPDRLGDYDNYPDECEETTKTVNNINKYIIKIEIFKEILNQIKLDDDDDFEFEDDDDDDFEDDEEDDNDGNDYKILINIIKNYLEKFPNIKIEYI
jgi:hypothetical protein